MYSRLDEDELWSSPRALRKGLAIDDELDGRTALFEGEERRRAEAKQGGCGERKTRAAE